MLPGGLEGETGKGTAYSDSRDSSGTGGGKAVEAMGKQKFPTEEKNAQAQAKGSTAQPGR